MKKYKLGFIKLTAIILFLCSCNSIGSKQELAEKIEKIIEPVVEKIESDNKEEELEFDERETIFAIIQKTMNFPKITEDSFIHLLGTIK